MTTTFKWTFLVAMYLMSVGSAIADETPACFAKVLKVYNGVYPYINNSYGMPLKQYNIGFEAVVEIHGEMSARKKIYTEFTANILTSSGTQNLDRLESSVVSPNTTIFHVISIAGFPIASYMNPDFVPQIINVDVTNIKCYPVVF